MEHQVNLNQPADQLLNEAAAFFARRRAKVSERSAQGFRFGLEGGDQQEGGRVTVAPAAGGGSTVTVRADGLGVLAMAEGFVRELRKQARGAGRQARQAGPSAARGGFGDLRQRLGLPAAERPPVPSQPGPTMAAGERAAEPDGPLPVEAPVVSPEAGPRSAPARPAPAAAPHPAFTGPQESSDQHPAAAPPVNEARAAQQPSAEAVGGVPAPEEVTVDAGAAPQSPPAPSETAPPT